MRFWQVGGCVVAVVCLAACGRVDGGVKVEGPAVTAVEWSGPSYISDVYGRAWQHPTEISVGESVYLEGLHWTGWGTARPTSTGVAQDTGCLAGCSGGKVAEYRVKVVLSGLTRRGDVAYYGHAAITPLKPPAPFWAEGNEDTILDVPDD
ncbi:hypothetical protein [Streptomyces acidiscabies]|uniref:Uncharacterized protein n=1 Tax=Streptomyces acidiscabies TaxID=42234 RepID=A0A0L0JW20_9ACTN|nr:hypothetical protein [Streptomyces acidiscabies]KND29972.1 hypothetical protein IQ63_29955 [Streptomyces acidiscabies]